MVRISNVDYGSKSRNVAKSIKTNPVKEQLDQLLRVLSLDTVLLELPERDVAIVCLIADTGLHPIDLKKLRWQHIFPYRPRGSVIDPEKMVVPEGIFAPVHGKRSLDDTKKLIFIGKATRDKLQDLLMSKPKVSDLVFKAERVRSGTKPERSMHEKTITNIWNRIVGELGYKGLTMHKVRAIRGLKDF